MNGTDEEVVPPAAAEARSFRVVFGGSIYIDRNPRMVLRAAARVVRQLALEPDRFGLDFIGNADSFGGVPLSCMAQEEGLGAYVRTHRPLPRREAMEFLAQAQMLLSLPQDTPLQIPSKLFEYMQFDAWLLVLAKRGSATEMLLRDTDADVVEPDDLEGIVAALKARYLQFAAGDRPSRIGVDGRFSRRVQAEALFDTLARRLGRGAATHIS